MKTAFKHIYDQGFADGEERGISIGIAEGKAKGIAKGMLKKALQIAKSLKNSTAISDETIAQVTSLTIEQVKNIDTPFYTITCLEHSTKPSSSRQYEQSAEDFFRSIYDNGVDDGEAKGITKGRAEGEAEGIKEGMLKKSISTAKKLKLLKTMSYETIAQVTDLSLEQVKAIVA